MSYQIYCVYSDNVQNQYDYFVHILSDFELSSQLTAQKISPKGYGRGEVGDEIWHNSVLEKLYHMKNTFIPDKSADIGVLTDLDVLFFYKDSIDKLLRYSGCDICFMQDAPDMVNTGFYIFYKNENVINFFNNLVNAIEKFPYHNDQALVNEILRGDNGIEYSYDGKKYNLTWSVYPEELAAVRYIREENFKSTLIYHAAGSRHKIEEIDYYKKLILERT